ncbi:hypothetical protein ACSVDA_20600 [Cytobacillus sp. Hm23]
MSCPSGSYSKKIVRGETGCTSQNKCGFLWQYDTSYTQIYEKCYDNKTDEFVGDYYKETDYGTCC